MFAEQGVTSKYNWVDLKPLEFGYVNDIDVANMVAHRLIVLLPSAH
jgi:hypothetical protein